MRWLSWLGSVCLAAAMVGAGVIYFPVVRAEVGYEVRGWLSQMMPNISLSLIPVSQPVTGYRLRIPKLYLDEPVVAGVDPANKPGYMAALRNGVAQAAGTAVPGQGRLGYYFAHSSGAGSTPQQPAEFYLLGKLQTGDEVDIYFGGNRYVYQVTGMRVVAPNDLSFLADTGGPERVVLQTCWPIGTNLKRLLVTAARVQ